MRPSLGSAGDGSDDAPCESSSATLECEPLARRRFASPSGARMAAFGSIESWDDPLRPHPALGYRSPVTYDREHARGAASAA